MIRQYNVTYAPSRRIASVRVEGESTEEFAQQAVGELVYRKSGWKPESITQSTVGNADPTFHLDLDEVRRLRRTGQWSKV